MVRIAIVLVLLIYLGGVVKFLQGFRRTNFARGLFRKLTLAILWPVLFTVNSSYRKNFRKALKS